MASGSIDLRPESVANRTVSSHDGVGAPDQHPSQAAGAGDEPGMSLLTVIMGRG